MHLIFILPGIFLITGLFALIEGIIHHVNPNLKGQYAYKGLILEGTILIISGLAFGWYVYYVLGGWG